METWQREHILKNLVELIKATTINTTLIASLKAKKVLSDGEAEQIEHQMLTPSEKSRTLYEVLPSKDKSFEVLIQSLAEIRQSAAAKILRENAAKLQNYRSISVDENHVLGIGASSKVFKGKFDDRDVAVKVLHTSLFDVELISREVDFLRKLDNHENIARFFIAENHESSIYIAMELGVISLEDEIKIKLLGIDPTSTLLECTKGLNHLHNHTVVHRNLKPANILLTECKQVKIADFGLSKQNRIGMSSMTVETAGWMAPEVLELLQTGMTNNETFKMRKSSDIFSLGCIFYFTLTNGLHSFGNHLERIYNISNDKPQLTETKIPGNWLELISKMISKSSKARPTTNEILCFVYAEVPPSQSNSTEARPPTKNLNSNYFAITADLPCRPNSSSTTAKNQNFRDNDAMAPTLKATSFGAKSSPANLDELTEQQLRIAAGDEIGEFSVRNHDIDSRNDSDQSKNSSVTTSIKESMDECKRSLRDEWKGEGFTLLHVAVIKENVATVEHLIFLGNDVNKNDDKGLTPLHYCLKSNKSVKEMLLILLKNGANIHAVDNDGHNVLCLAALWGHSKETLELIVEAGADINLFVKCKDEDGATIMHGAVRGLNLEAIKYFKSLGVGIDSRDDRGRTPLHSILLEVNFFEKFNLALDNGANINAVDSDGDSTLRLAAAWGLSRDKLEAIVAAGADLNSKDKYGWTILHAAVFWGNLDVVSYFIELGLSIHEKSNEGLTPLHGLMYTNKNFEAILNFLLKHGADINSPDKNGHTLLCRLERNNRPAAHIDLVKRLGGISDN